MAKARALLFLLLVLLLVACGRVPPPRQGSADYTGTVERVCSPVDAVGHELRLERQSGDGPPFVIITIWSREAYRDGLVLRLDGAADQGQLLTCSGPQDCQAVDLAYLQLETGWEQGRAAGRFWSRLGGLNARFHAEPSEGPGPICG